MTKLDHLRLSRNLRAASFGFFLVLVGAFLIMYPLVEEARAFLRDLTFTPIVDHLYYPTPSSPHPLFYRILRDFAIVWGIWLAFLTILQLATRDRARRVTHTLGDCVFWMGGAYLLNRIAFEALNFGTFLALLIVVAGLSLIVRALVLLGLERMNY